MALSLHRAAVYSPSPFNNLTVLCPLFYHPVTPGVFTLQPALWLFWPRSKAFLLLHPVATSQTLFLWILGSVRHCPSLLRNILFSWRGSLGLCIAPPSCPHVPSSSLYSCPPSPVPLKTGIPQCPVLGSLFLFYIHHGAISSLPRCQGLAKNADVFPIYFSNLHLSPGHNSPEPNSQSQLLWLKNLIYQHIQSNFFSWGGGETKL